MSALTAVRATVAVPVFLDLVTRRFQLWAVLAVSGEARQVVRAAQEGMPYREQLVLLEGGWVDLEVQEVR